MVTTSTRIDNPETAALARHILLSIFLETDGFHLAACRLSNLPEATAPAMMYALRSHWLELKGTGVCLTNEGRQLAINQPNYRQAFVAIHPATSHHHSGLGPSP